MKDIPNYDEVWRQKTDEQLFDALAHWDDYNPESVEAVRREIARRNLTEQNIQGFETQATKTRKEEAIFANMPLQWPMRILMFFLSFGIPQIVVGEYYRNKGFQRKHRETWKWMVYGLVFWILVLVVRMLTSV